MCDHCGCGKSNHEHDDVHGHAHGHDHTHGHESDTGHKPGIARTVRIEADILGRNDEIAAQNRALFAEHGVIALNMISAPGTGKTRLLEATLSALQGRIPCAVIAGDQKTDHDARRLSGKGAPVRQIETMSACHLDARRVNRVLPDLLSERTRLLFIENVGNLVCPAAFDLGETFKIALMSVTEGEDKPLKYPSLFTQAPIVLLTKIDLLPHLQWDMAACRRNLQRARPGVRIVELSAITGEGMDDWMRYLVGLCAPLDQGGSRV